LIGAEHVSVTVAATVERRAARATPLDRGTPNEVPLRLMSQNVAMTLIPVGLRRTADSVPIILGSVLGFLMITVFSIAAVFIKFAR
jgi:hypothetical protein